MIVDLPAPDGPTSAVTVPGSDRKLTSCKHFLARVVRKAHVFHSTWPLMRPSVTVRPGGFVFLFLVQNFARALESGNRFRNLRADGHDLKDRSDQQAQENVERKKLSQASC